MRKYRKPHRIKRKKSILKNRFFWLIILIFIIFSSVFYLISFYSFFQIKEIQISGHQKVSSENLENLIREKINKRILFFSTKSIFLVNLKEINKNILEEFPQIEKVKLKRKFPNKIGIQIEERKPIAIFCLNYPNSSKENLNEQKKSCFSIDKEGVIFEFAENKSDLIKLKKEIDKEVNLGEKIISQQDLSRILETESKLKNELKISSEEIFLVSEERFNIKTGEEWQIYFNLKEDLNWQLTKLKAVLEKEIPQEKRKKLEYIDLRFSNLAPYKYK